MVIHSTVSEMLAQEHIAELRDEASRERVAATVRHSRRENLPDRSAPRHDRTA